MKTVKQEVMKYKEMPDVKAFAERLAERIGRPEADPEMILEVMADEVFKDWDPSQMNYEYRKTRNWMRAFGYLFWTERIEEQDYSEEEREFMDILARYWSADPDFLEFKGMRLLNYN
jgi:hypothetical protein